MFKEKAEPLFESGTTIAKDLKMNLFNLSESSSLSQDEYFLILLGLATAKNNPPLVELASEKLKELGAFNDEQILEARQAPAIMGMLNSYYKFRNFLKKNQAEREETYGPAKLRMMSLGNPKLGKQNFEMLALAISIVNSCEQCVVAHEEALTKLGVPVEKLHDLVRLTATVNGIAAL